MIQHRQKEADLTLAVAASDPGTAQQHHTVAVDERGRVRALFPPGAQERGPLTVMGIWSFSSPALERRLGEDVHDLLGDLLPRMLAAGDRVLTFAHRGYWNPLHSVRDYWQAHMDLLREGAALNLQDASWPIRTAVENRPPIRISARAKVSHSLLSEGCVVDGTVERAVLSPGVYVAAGAVVRNAVVMRDTIIGQRALVENAVLDANVVVGAHAQVGQLRRRAPTLGPRAPDPLIVVTRGVHVPAQQGILTYGPVAGRSDGDALRAFPARRPDAPRWRERAVG
jgi:glucose-1-phosphate adenylyltransferase